MLRRKTDGFTLVELLVVMAIIAMLLSIAAPRDHHLQVERGRPGSESHASGWRHRWHRRHLRVTRPG